MEDSPAEASVYAIDASSLIAIGTDRVSERDNICSFLVQLVNFGRLKTVVRALNEVKDPSVTNHFQAVRSRFVVPDIELLSHIGNVMSRFSWLQGQYSRKDRADPWLVALAWKYGYTVVTEESPQRSRKIPAACRQLNIPCINLDGLLAREGYGRDP